MKQLNHELAHYKQHLAYKNGTQKVREDKRVKDIFYEAINEWTR